MRLERRLSNLEARSSRENPQGNVPMGVLIHLKAVARLLARERGEEPPPYTQEEVEELHRDDLAEAAGGGVIGHFRNSLGWRSPESLDLLAAWEEGARRRLERVEDGEPLEVVYNEQVD